MKCYQETRRLPLPDLRIASLMIVSPRMVPIRAACSVGEHVRHAPFANPCYRIGTVEKSTDSSLTLTAVKAGSCEECRASAYYCRRRRPAKPLFSPATSSEDEESRISLLSQIATELSTVAPFQGCTPTPQPCLHVSCTLSTLGSSSDLHYNVRLCKGAVDTTSHIR